MELARGVLIAGKYRLERPLASGGMGAVWVARHVQLETPSAIKFMDPASASSTVARARFEREARAAATLRNRHVVNVTDYGVEGDLPYLVMELLQGEDLSKRLHRERRLPLAAMARILTQAAKGLRPAHEARVVHRDLKPANLFLARVDDEDEEIVKILDFGIAKETAGDPLGEGTKTGELMGSPHYMSPEQVRGARDLDPRSDLWSLAVITFRAVTGRLPFSGDQIGAVIAQILADPIPVATQIVPDLPRELDAFFVRGFARDRDQRFQTARELAEAFAAIASSGAIADAGARWSIADEPPTRPRMPSSYPTESPSHPTGGSVATPPPSSARAELSSIPTEAISTGIPPSGALGGTGGPVIHTAPPPAPPRASPLRWLPLGGAVVGVVIGVGAFLAVRPSKPVAPSAAPSAETSAVASASAAASTETAPKPTASVTAEPAASAQPVATAEPTASASAPTPASKPSAKPAAKAPVAAPPPPAKKKPNWGF